MQMMRRIESLENELILTSVPNFVPLLSLSTPHLCARSCSNPDIGGVFPHQIRYIDIFRFGDADSIFAQNWRV